MLEDALDICHDGASDFSAILFRGVDVGSGYIASGSTIDG
jgi:hypothetical protein